eukprot:GFYU01003819.1.p1 GENE.GFYU01003819.1~~GFYU01003819.1.p1  ORF type:complete len:233 (-),score=31.79 GFYU01003819.1:83-781(-)
MGQSVTRCWSPRGSPTSSPREPAYASSSDSRSHRICGNGYEKYFMSLMMAAPAPERRPSGQESDDPEDPAGIGGVAASLKQMEIERNRQELTDNIHVPVGRDLLAEMRAAEEAKRDSVGALDKEAIAAEEGIVADGDADADAVDVAPQPPKEEPQLNPEDMTMMFPDVIKDTMVDLDHTCPTCLEAFEPDNPAILTSCSHMFHLPCIYEWQQRSRLCPVCQKTLEFDESLVM